MLGKQEFTLRITMEQKKFSFLSLRSLALPPAAMSTTLISYFVLNIALAYIMLFFPPLGLIGAITINLVVLFFLRSRFAIPLYILIAGPSVGLTLSQAGTLSRVYIGNLLFLLIVGIWILQVILPSRKSGQRTLELSLLVPLALLIFI
jgi:hypothetical protein